MGSPPGTSYDLRITDIHIPDTVPGHPNQYIRIPTPFHGVLLSWYSSGIYHRNDISLHPLSGLFQQHHTVMYISPQLLLNKNPCHTPGIIYYRNTTITYIFRTYVYQSVYTHHPHEKRPRNILTPTYFCYTYTPNIHYSYYIYAHPTTLFHGLLISRTTYRYT